LLFILLLAGAVAGVGAVAAQHAAAPAGPTADAVLAELKAGNDHHSTEHYVHPHLTPDRRKELASGQHPHAAVLACADSRVPPEIVFDQGLGDLFVIRVAGNIPAEGEMASLEYAAEHLHVPVVVVLGHQKCGGVTAAVEGGELPGHMGVIVREIKPAVDKARGMPGDLVANAVRTNVQMVVDRLRQSKPILAEMVDKHQLTVVGGVYSLDTGRVDWIK